MPDVDQIFNQFVEAMRSGNADPREYLDQVEYGERLELEALIDGYLEHGPGRPWDPAAFAASPAARVVDGIVAEWEATPEPLGWGALLPKLRDAAEITRGKLVERLAVAIGHPGATKRVGDYYHQMELGQLPAEGVSDEVLGALGEIVGETAAKLREAGSAIGEGVSIEGASDMLVHARLAVEHPDFAAPAPAARPAAEGDDETDDDAVDRLFTGGPNPG